MDYKTAQHNGMMERYNAVPEYIRDDLVEALIWARDTLRDKEGAGHDFQIIADRDMMLCCCFAKPSWAGDHSGPWRDQASHAVVLAVCSYLVGM